MERLRTALNWELAPVIADFSPFNAEAPTIFDKARSTKRGRYWRLLLVSCMPACFTPS